MASTVKEAFEEFNRNSVNLLTSRTQRARSSRDWLIEQLNLLDSKEDLNFPYKFSAQHINYGSFQRRTKIRELDDIDLMFCLTADGATYTKHSEILYVLNTSGAGERLKKISDDGVLNFRKVVNKFLASLGNVSQYQSANLNRRGEAAVLNLHSYEWVFDIVPCFYTDTNIYLIPDGHGNWKPSDPRVDQARTNNANPLNNNHALQLIRTLKYWNINNSTHTIPSYLFENLVLNFMENNRANLSNLDFDIKEFFYYLSSAILLTVPDPQGFKEDLNTFSIEEKLAISRKADESYNNAKEAITQDIHKDSRSAIEWWGKIFGESFPFYS